MNQESDKKAGLKGLGFLANWLLGPVFIWATLAVLITAPFPFYAGIGSLLHWANVALAGSLIYDLIKGPRLGVAVMLYWLAAVWVVTFYGPNWPRGQFFLVLWGIVWVGQALRLMVPGERPGLFREVPFLLAGPLWLARRVYERLGAVY